MTREQARRSPMQNVITRAIGTAPEVIADVQEIDLRRDDMYLIASDGLTRELTDTALRVYCWLVTAIWTRPARI